MTHINVRQHKKRTRNKNQKGRKTHGSTGGREKEKGDWDGGGEEGAGESGETEENKSGKRRLKTEKKKAKEDQRKSGKYNVLKAIVKEKK